MIKSILILLILFKCCLTDVSYYEILGVTKEATTQEIKHAYKKLAIKLHPDKNSNKDQQKKFLEVTEAYETLKDSQKRHQYDLYGSQQSYTRRYDYQSQTEYNNLYYNGLYHQDPFVETLSPQSFYSYLDEGFYFLNFYSPFCPPCQSLAKHWKKLAEIYKGIVNVGAVNCKYYNNFCYNNMRIGSYPSLLFYPNGKNGNYLYYNGGHTFDALEDFVLKFIRNRVKVPVIAQVVKSEEPTLFVVNKDNIDDNTILRIAYHLNGLVNVYNAVHIRQKISKNADAVLVFKHKQKREEIESTDEKEIIKEILDLLPPVEKIDTKKLQKIRNQLRSEYETPWVLYFTTQDDDKLALYKMTVSVPQMNFGAIRCDEAEELCRSLQAERAPAWALLKAGGAFQLLRAPPRAPPAAPAPPPAPAALRRAARARALHSLSGAELQRALAGDTGIWVLLIAPYKVSWEHLEEPFTQASIELLETGISFGIMSCTDKNDKYCLSLTQNEPLILVQNDTNTFRYSGDTTKNEIIDFIELLEETSGIELSVDDISDIERGGESAAWLVAFLPARCGRACDAPRRAWRRAARRLLPLNFLKVGMVDCDKLEFPFCNMIRSVVAKFYPHDENNRIQTLSLQHLTEAPYILASVLDLVYRKVTSLNWQSFNKNVVAEELYPSRDKKPWLVYFHSPRCYHCYEMYPDFVITAYKLQNSLQFGKVNCISDRNVCQHEHITHYPSIKLYLNRNQQHSQSSVIIFQPKHYKSLLEDIKPHLVRYNQNDLDNMKNIEIKSHINFRDEL